MEQTNRVLVRGLEQGYGAAGNADKNMIYSIKPKLSVAAVALAVLYSLVAGGCSDSASEPRLQRPRRASRSRQNMPVTSYKPASAADVRVAKSLIRSHLHALGNSDFHLALNLLTPEYRRGVGDEEHLRFMISNFYRDFMQVKKVRWSGFSKDAQSRNIQVDLILESRSGNMTRVYYLLNPQNGQYLINGVQAYPLGQTGGGQDSRANLQNRIAEKMFSGVLFSPTPRHRVLDSPSASL